MKANDKHNSLDSVCNNFCWLNKELARLKKLLLVAPAASSHSVRGVISPSYRFMPRRGTESSDRQAFSAFSPAVCQYTSSPHGRASFTESVHTFSFDITGLKSSFHESILKKSCKMRKIPPYSYQIRWLDNWRYYGKVWGIISPEGAHVKSLSFKATGADSGDYW